MTYSEYDNVFDIYVGNLLGDSDLDVGVGISGSTKLRVIDIEQNGIDNTNTNVTVLYSTSNTPNTQSVPDQANSWVESFDISTVDEAVETYIDQGTGIAVDWEDDWETNKPSGASDTAPELIIRKPHMVFNVAAYGSKLEEYRIAESLGRINGVNFLVSYFGFPPQSEIPHDVLVDDYDQWLFAACPISRPAKNTWRYDFTFEYSGNLEYGWNDVEGLEVVRYNNKNPFNSNELFNFMDLFAGMNFVGNTDVSVATGR
jgi:hypothetical protein